MILQKYQNQNIKRSECLFQRYNGFKMGIKRTLLDKHTKCMYMFWVKLPFSLQENTGIELKF